MSLRIGQSRVLKRGECQNSSHFCPTCQNIFCPLAQKKKKRQPNFFDCHFCRDEATIFMQKVTKPHQIQQIVKSL